MMSGSQTGQCLRWAEPVAHTLFSVSYSGQVELNRDSVAMEASECSDVELGQLDMDLDRKSRQHNLTSRNVRAILHVSETGSPQGAAFWSQCNTA